MTLDDVLFELETKKCLVCDGHGSYEDYEENDTDLKTFKCGSCNGTGWRYGVEYVLIPKEN